MAAGRVVALGVVGPHIAVAWLHLLDIEERARVAGDLPVARRVREAEASAKMLLGECLHAGNSGEARLVPVSPEYSIVGLTCCFDCGPDAVMVGEVFVAGPV